VPAAPRHTFLAWWARFTPTIAPRLRYPKVCSQAVGGICLARIIHERSVELRFAHRMTDAYTEKVADSLHYRLETPKIEFPLFINETRLRE
jgi:hypothetical protein